MKSKNIVLTIVGCIIVLMMIGYNYSYSKSKDSQTQEMSTGLEDISLKVEKLSKEIDVIKTELDNLKLGSKDYTKEIQEIIKKQIQLQSVPKQSGAGLKIAVVSIRKIFQQCKKGTSYRQEAIAEQDRIVAELEKLSKEIDAERAVLKTLKEDSSDYVVLTKGLFEKQAAYQARQEFYKQQMELRDKLWTKEIYQDIVRIAGDVAKENGLDLVLREDEVDFSEPSSSELGLAMRVQKLLYSGGCLDITDEIIARLDAGK